MTESMSLNELIARIRSEWAGWEAELSRFDLPQMEDPLLPGGWSVKDAVAHVTWSEREMVGLLESRSLKHASPLWAKTTDERNHIVYEENRLRPVEDVLRDARAVHERLMELIAALDDHDLRDPTRFGDMPAEWVPWQILRGSTYKHYREHGEDLKTIELA